MEEGRGKDFVFLQRCRGPVINKDIAVNQQQGDFMGRKLYNVDGYPDLLCHA